MLSREEAIKNIFERHGENSLYITNTGYLSRAIYNIYPDNKNILYMQGSMGLSPAIGLGAARNIDKDVVVFVGDASLLMHLGITHTIRDEALGNLYIYVLDNGCHESVGEYKCSDLELNYVGVNEIIKISNDGKTPRVGLSCKENIENLRSFLNV
tara:strand:+ start:9331 stop:9795 length:465 start_codon:yes stop_codon:yes gene_type:complete